MLFLAILKVLNFDFSKYLGGIFYVPNLLRFKVQKIQFWKTYEIPPSNKINEFTVFHIKFSFLISTSESMMKLDYFFLCQTLYRISVPIFS